MTEWTPTRAGQPPRGASWRFYLLTGPGPQWSGAEMAGRIRGHWEIENRLHWTLDTTFGEDGAATRTRGGIAASSWLRRVAASVLMGEEGGWPPGTSVRQRQRLSAANPKGLLTRLRAVRPPLNA